MQMQLNLPNSLAAAQSLFLDRGHPVTASRAIAERFGKRHKDVLKVIKNLLADLPDLEFGRRNFAPSSYQNAQNKTQPEYHLTRDGFALLAMAFTGKEALAWKIAFLDAFNALEADLAARVAREANALYRLRPHWRAIGEGTANHQSRAEICTLTGHKATATITANRRRMRQVGLLPADQRLAA